MSVEAVAYAWQSPFLKEQRWPEAIVHLALADSGWVPVDDFGPLAEKVGMPSEVVGYICEAMVERGLARTEESPVGLIICPVGSYPSGRPKAVK